MDVAHAVIFAKKIDISRVAADDSSAKFESLDEINTEPKHKTPSSCTY